MSRTERFYKIDQLIKGRRLISFAELQSTLGISRATLTRDLDVWCHKWSELRNFSINSIRRTDLLEKPGKEVPDRTVDAVLGPGYGIFGGKARTWAELRFTPERARWVSTEAWHPKQTGWFEEDGS